MEDLIEGLRSALETLIGKGFQLPFHVAAIGLNGSFLPATYVPAEDGLEAQVHSMHGARDFKAPINVMFVDNRGEAARVIVGGAGNTTVLQ
jgi:hypothetical protein